MANKLFLPGGVHIVPEAPKEPIAAQVPEFDPAIETVKAVIHSIQTGRFDVLRLVRKTTKETVPVFCGLVPVPGGRFGVVPLMEVLTGAANELYDAPEGARVETEDPLVEKVDIGG